MESNGTIRIKLKEMLEKILHRKLPESDIISWGQPPSPAI